MRRELAARGLEIDYPSVYRMLRSLQRDGQLRSRWGRTVSGPRRRLYEITPAGRRGLAEIAGRLGVVSHAHDAFFAAYGQTPDQLRDAPAGPSSSPPAGEAAVHLLGLDHLALSVVDPGAMAAFLCDHVGMRELGHSADGLLVGADPDGAKFTLIPVGAPTEPAALARVFLAVRDLEHAVASLPADVEMQMQGPRAVTFDGPEQLGLGFTVMSGRETDYEIRDVVLRAAEPRQTAIALTQLGCVPRAETLQIADTRITLEELPAWSERPLLRHLAVRVQSIDAIAREVRRRALDVIEPVADDTVTVVLPGVEQLRFQFVEARQRE